MVTITCMSCCGMKEIHQLQQITKADTSPWSAKAAMIQLLYNSNIYAVHPNYLPNARNQKVYGLVPPMYCPMGAHILFTDAHEPTKGPNNWGNLNPTHIRYGKAFAKFIVKNELGTIVATKQAPNPNYFPKVAEGITVSLNTAHQITCYLWTVNHKALRDFAVLHVPDPFVDGKITVPENEWSLRLQNFWSGTGTWEALMAHKLKGDKVQDRVDKMVATPPENVVRVNMAEALTNLAAAPVPPVQAAVRRQPRLGLRW